MIYTMQGTFYKNYTKDSFFSKYILGNRTYIFYLLKSHWFLSS